MAITGPSSLRGSSPNGPAGPVCCPRSAASTIPTTNAAYAVAEAFWARMQTELLDRQRWRTRLELANAIFEYIEGFHNRRRRHSALGWMSPLEFETTTPALDPDSSPACP